MYRLATIIIILISTHSMYPYDCMVDGIYYDLDRVMVEASVTYKKKSKETKEYKGELLIPEKISFEGDTFTVTAIGASAFSSCNNLTSVIIPNTVTFIGECAFFRCEKLSEVILPDKLKYINSWLFYFCHSLLDIYIPPTVEIIRDWAFCNCRSIKNIVIPSSVESIGEYAFATCVSLETINIPPSVGIIERNAFSNCNQLRKVTVNSLLWGNADKHFPGNPEYLISDIVPEIKPPHLSRLADTDYDIPSTDIVSDQTFALIISNEHYAHEQNVPFALNDGKVFADYMSKTLGIPEDNIIRIENASLAEFDYGINRVSNICKAFDGDASLIVYYAGHGLPDEKNREAFLLPVDAKASDTQAAYPINKLFSMLSEMPSRQTVVFLDACFSGSQRNGDMMQSVRGVRIKPKNSFVSGNTVVISASQGDETAHPYEEQRHGLFTYFLLKKLKESEGETTLGEISDYVKTNVQQTSALKKKTIQTPTIIPSLSARNWNEWKLK